MEKGVEMAGDLGGATILFDLDGTLVDTAEDLAASMNHALSADGLGPIPPCEVRHLVGYGARRMLMRGYQIALEKDADGDRLDAAFDRFLTHYEANIAVHSRPFAGVVDIIERLRADGARMAVCTNKREAMAALLLEALGLAPLFDFVAGADTAAASKPDPAPVLLCLKKTGAARGVFIGDSDTDIRAAEAAGLPCLIADFGYGPLTLSDRASKVFSRYCDAEAFIRSMLAPS